MVVVLVLVMPGHLVSLMLMLMMVQRRHLMRLLTHFLIMMYR